MSSVHDLATILAGVEPIQLTTRTIDGNNHPILIDGVIPTPADNNNKTARAKHAKLYWLFSDRLLCLPVKELPADADEQAWLSRYDALYYFFYTKLKNWMQAKGEKLVKDHAVRNYEMKKVIVCRGGKITSQEIGSFYDLQLALCSLFLVFPNAVG
jgi:hypothetical protein